MLKIKYPAEKMCFSFEEWGNKHKYERKRQEKVRMNKSSPRNKLQEKSKLNFQRRKNRVR